MTSFYIVLYCVVYWHFYIECFSCAFGLECTESLRINFKLLASIFENFKGFWPWPFCLDFDNRYQLLELIQVLWSNKQRNSVSSEDVS